MSPESLLPNSDDPHAKIVIRISIYPFRGLDNWLTSTAVASNKVNWLLKSFIVSGVGDQ